VSGDFNNDGLPDIATAGVGYLEVALATGTGWFGPVVATSAPFLDIRPIAIAAGDFNGDGNLDVAAMDQYTQPRYYVFLGDGRGRFTMLPQTPLAVVPIGACFVADTNQDGKLDLTTATESGVAVFLGAGDGTFGPPILSLGRSGITIGDFNGDGVPDIGAAVEGGMIEIALGDGMGRFVTSYTTYLATAYSLVAKDVNVDGKVDLLVVSKGRVVIYAGNGDGGLQEPQIVNTLKANEVDVADFNLDGTPDLAVMSLGAVASIWLADGSGTYTSTPRAVVASATLPILIGDFNADGYPDLASADEAGAVMSVLFTAPGGRFIQGPKHPLQIPDVVQGAVSADFDGDGIPDVAAVNGTNNLYLRFGTGNRVNPLSPVVSTTYPAGAFYQAATGDFNTDGKVDLALADASGSVAVLVGNGDGIFQQQPSLPAGVQVDFVATGDLNGDGAADVIAANKGGNVITFIGNGDGTFEPGSRFEELRSLTGAVIAADFNQDGRSDVILAVARGGALMFLTNPDGSLQPYQRVNAGEGYDEALAGDVNGDGNMDLVLTNILHVATLPGKGDGSFLPPILTNVDDASSPGVLVDLDGDRHLDFAIPSRSQNGVTVGAGDGSGAFAPLAVFGASLFPNAVVSGDFDRDGRPDLLAISGPGLVYEFEANSYTAFFNTSH
jgi:hypothetical protein